MNNDLISRSELKKAVDKRGKSDCVDWFEGVYSIADMYDLIDNAPTVNLDKTSFMKGYNYGCDDGKRFYERPKGEWIFDGWGNYCSGCGYRPKIGGGKFCSECGADMRGKEE